MNYEKISYKVADPGVATITLDDPATRNALGQATLKEVIHAFETAREDAEVRCVVLTSSHEKVSRRAATWTSSRLTCRRCTSISAQPSSRGCSPSSASWASR